MEDGRRGGHRRGGQRSARRLLLRMAKCGSRVGVMFLSFRRDNQTKAALLLTEFSLAAFVTDQGVETGWPNCPFQGKPSESGGDNLLPIAENSMSTNGENTNGTYSCITTTSAIEHATVTEPRQQTRTAQNDRRGFSCPRQHSPTSIC